MITLEEFKKAVYSVYEDKDFGNRQWYLNVSQEEYMKYYLDRLEKIKQNEHN